MTDYYGLLGISKGAQNTEVQKAIRDARRKWTARQNNSSAEIRAEAEQAMRDIADAERILLNPSKRADYDQQLEQSQRKRPGDTWTLPVEDVNTPQPEDWLSHALQLIQTSSWPDVVSYMASVVKQYPGEAHAWYVYGYALSSCERFDEATSALMKCVSIDPSKGAALKMLGDLCYDRRRFSDAEDWYTRATRMDEDYRIDLADAQDRQGKYSEALSNASMAWEARKDDETVQEIYIRCLRNHTYQSLSVDTLNGIYEITNEAQLNYMKSKLPQFDALRSSKSQKVRQIIDQAHDLVTAAEAKNISIPEIAGFSVGALVLFIVAAPLNLVLIPVAAYRIYRMMQPNYKTSRSTVDRRTGLQK